MFHDSPIFSIVKSVTFFTDLTFSVANYFFFLAYESMREKLKKKVERETKKRIKILKKWMT